MWHTNLFLTYLVLLYIRWIFLSLAKIDARLEEFKSSFQKTFPSIFHLAFSVIIERGSVLVIFYNFLFVIVAGQLIFRICFMCFQCAVSYFSNVACVTANVDELYIIMGTIRD